MSEERKVDRLYFEHETVEIVTITQENRLGQVYKILSLYILYREIGTSLCG